MATVELTQFSMQEFNAFRQSIEGGLDLEEAEKTLKERAMSMFLYNFHNYSFGGLGGVENIQRVRVLGERGKRFDAQALTFEFVPKLPPALVIERKAREEKEAKKKEVLAEVERLRTDPKALEQFIKDVVAVVLGRAIAIGMLKELPGKKAPRKVARKPVTFDEFINEVEAETRAAGSEAVAEAEALRDHFRLAAPKLPRVLPRQKAAMDAVRKAGRVADDFAKAVAQDRRNRAEAATKAAAEFHKQERK